MTDWQPIETAPLDEFVLLFFTEIIIHSGKVVTNTYPYGGPFKYVKAALVRDPASGRFVDDFFQEMPTHWMPLPAPPTIRKNQKDEK